MIQGILEEESGIDLNDIVASEYIQKYKQSDYK